MIPALVFGLWIKMERTNPPLAVGLQMKMEWVCWMAPEVIRVISQRTYLLLTEPVLSLTIKRWSCHLLQLSEITSDSKRVETSDWELNINKIKLCFTTTGRDVTFWFGFGSDFEKNSDSIRNEFGSVRFEKL